MTRMPDRLARLFQPKYWGVSARSAAVAGSVVFVALTVAGVVLAAVVYRTLLSGVESAAVHRVGQISADLESGGPAQLDATLLATDRRVLAVQVMAPNGTVVRRSPSAPTTPLIPLDEIGPGLQIGIPEHASPFGQIQFSSGTVDTRSGRYIVLVGEGTEAVMSTVQAVAIALAVWTPLVMGVSAAATFVLVRRSMRSVDRIRTRVAEISTSDLAERVPVPNSRDEIAALAQTMNEMLARIEDGHAAQKRFVADASHELRSPLATIISALEVAADHPELLDQELAVSTLMPEAHRMRLLVDDLLLLARADEHGLAMGHDDVDLDDLAAREAEKLRRETSLQIRADISPTRVTGDAGALARVLRNLVDNAARHTVSLIDISVHTDGDRAVMSVGDDGPGIPEPDRLRVFDRFVRLDPDRSRRGGGSGLGLAIVAEVVAAHHGSVRIEDSPAGGTRVTVQLPLAGASYAPESSR
ncbi:HAMP domain-containing histidine kinase [Mycolicibacterium wolinskyi]|uniref:histidine kinase n=2 Tax=Mycobacteriaceae TaxID=1762 RepID=A0A1X2EVT0_9MYCO|nr:HAMP domain-containing sensor histidine kinase [Mycolicibacterium wolinskyi]MCV7289731.1 HAMP domain-containing histidine kinase [Mycolicibacterium wolinskyi]MCV7296702.1 HAMP domain-containing histidine kinase [Mycolicibacterium goodii]ORX10148.1 histidine kinase [Mycolicibacterium wolinskyi]